MTHHAPLSDEDVARLPIAAGRSELLEEIMSTSLADRIDRPRPEADRRRPRWPVLAAAVAAVLAITAVPAWLAARDDTTSDPAPAAPPGTTYVELDLPGWQVVDFDGDPDGEVEVTFGAGDQEVTIKRLPASSYPDYLHDMGDDVETVPVEVLGQSTRLASYNARDHVVGAPLDDDFYAQIRGGGVSRERFTELLGGLREVGEDDFLATLETGETVVFAPSELDEAVADTLADIPEPDGFSTSAIELSGINAQYGVVAEVTGAVTCAWIQKYAAAQGSGDRVAEQEAADAMATSREWSGLREIREGGDWPRFLWQAADEMTAGTPAERIDFGCS